jgi:hypothetical protein
MPAPSKARIEAIAKQLVPKSEGELPPILKFAGPSNGPRMKGLVTIITGPFKVSRAPPLPCPALPCPALPCPVRRLTRSRPVPRRKLAPRHRPCHRPPVRRERRESHLPVRSCRQLPQRPQGRDQQSLPRRRRPRSQLRRCPRGIRQERHRPCPEDLQPPRCLLCQRRHHRTDSAFHADGREGLYRDLSGQRLEVRPTAPCPLPLPLPWVD